MAENPATWGRAEHVVNDTFDAWWQARQEHRAGFSLARQITNALRREGLLVDEESGE